MRGGWKEKKTATIDKVDFGHFPEKSKTPVFGRRKSHKNKT